MGINNVYIAGDMLPKGSQLLRAQERDELNALGIKVYNPADNDEINDKENLDNNEGLAEKIVRQDTDGIRRSDVVVIEPQPFAMGTMVELGQIKGMKDIAKDINVTINKYLDELNEDFDSKSDHEVADKLLDLLVDISKITIPVVEQKVFPHYEDIRRFKGATESEDRRSLGINQYVYGVVLDVTHGHGFYEWDEVIEELSKLKGDE